jgi:MraZ protein
MRESFFSLKENGPMILFCPSPGQALHLYPPSEWTTVQRKTQAKAQTEKKPHLPRLLNSRAHQIPLEEDGNGRLLIPKNVVDYFKEDGEVHFIGVGSKIELFNKADCEALNATLSDDDFQAEMGDILDY